MQFLGTGSETFRLCNQFGIHLLWRDTYSHIKSETFFSGNQVNNIHVIFFENVMICADMNLTETTAFQYGFVKNSQMCTKLSSNDS